MMVGTGIVVFTKHCFLVMFSHCRLFEMNLMLIKNRLVINRIIVMIVIFSLAIVMAI